MQRAVLHAEREATHDPAGVVGDQIEREVLDEKKAVMLQGHTVQGVQNRVPRPVRGGRAAVRLAALAELQGLAT